MNDEQFITPSGQVFRRLLDGTTSDYALEKIIAEHITEVLADLAEQIADDPDFTDAQRAQLLARARPMVESTTRTNLTGMRNKLRH